MLMGDGGSAQPPWLLTPTTGTQDKNRVGSAESIASTSIDEESCTTRTVTRAGDSTQKAPYVSPYHLRYCRTCGRRHRHGQSRHQRKPPSFRQDTKVCAKSYG